MRIGPTLVLAGLVPLAGCSSAAPVIDDVQMPATASATKGEYVLKGVISFHDDGGVVRKVRIQLGQEVHDFDATQRFRRATTPLEVRFAAATPKGKLDYLVSLVDEAGLVSEARRLSVALR